LNDTLYPFFVEPIFRDLSSPACKNGLPVFERKPLMDISSATVKILFDIEEFLF